MSNSPEARDARAIRDARIRDLCDEGMSAREIAREMGISDQMVYLIVGPGKFSGGWRGAPNPSRDPVKRAKLNERMPWPEPEGPIVRTGSPLAEISAIHG